MKYYPYSVNKVLTEHFGNDALSGIRKPHGAFFHAEDRSALLPLSWQYADERTLQLFLGRRFLVRTNIEDDYIAYIYQQGERLGVFLMFMLYEENAPFTIDPGYALQLVNHWEQAGYEAKIVSQCIGVEEYNHGERFRFEQHTASGMGTSVYTLVQNGGNKILVLDTHDCWPVFYEKLVQAAATDDIREYECLFEPTVSITTGDKTNRKTLAVGIPAIKSFLEENAPVRICFEAFGNSGIFNRILLAGQNRLNIWVNVRNLIVELNLSECRSARLVNCCSAHTSKTLQERVPTLCSVRALNITQMHGYAVQLRYADDSIRNYYLQMFDQLQVPGGVVVDGFGFDEQVLRSVQIEHNGIRFANGYAVAAHRLYYRSYRQVQALPVQQQYENGFAKSGYRLPLKEFKDHYQVRHYWGERGECYGPADALLDQDGKRITDASFYGGFDSQRSRTVRKVCMEPTGRYGFLRKDGTWLVPPVYTSADEYEESCLKVTRTVDGRQMQFLLTPEGREISFDYEIDIVSFDGGLCLFNAAAEPVSAPTVACSWYWDYDGIKPGKWGFVDLEGNVVVPPQYVYALDFYNGGGERAVVAKFVDGELCWGVIDRTGKEVISCKYESVYTRWGDAFAFRRYGEELYGVMDLNGYNNRGQRKCHIKSM